MLRALAASLIALGASPALAEEPPQQDDLRILLPPAPRDPLIWPVEGTAQEGEETPARFQRMYRRAQPLCLLPGCPSASWHRQPSHLRLSTR